MQHLERVDEFIAIERGSQEASPPDRSDLPGSIAFPAGNKLLAALPDADYRRLAPHLEWVAMPRSMVLSDHSRPMTHAYFPTDALVSMIAELSDGGPTEVAIVGNEGLVSISTILEGPNARSPLRRSVVRVAGHGYRIGTERLLEEFQRAGKLQHWLLRYTQALITQVAQIAACIRCHRLDEQVCRWLLQRLHWMGWAELRVTHREIAALLGVRREGVTEAMIRLQNSGVVRYIRGQVVVLDRERLAKRACECFGVIQKEYARLLSA